MNVLEVERVIDIDRATMWSLWTSEDHLARWMRPSIEGFGPTIAQIDLRPNGAYRFEMIRADGTVHAVTGTFVDIEEPELLSYTWKWEVSEETSFVRVRFSSADGGTRVEISHSKLSSLESVEQHREGWEGCLTSLEAIYT